MAYPLQHIRSFPLNFVGRFLLFGVCLLGVFVMVPPESAAQPRAAQPKKPLPWELLARAQTLEAQKQYEQAIAAYREYLALRPANDKVWVSLARLLARQGNPAEAEHIYGELLARQPEQAELHLELARLRASQKKFSEAQASYVEVLKKDPKNREARRGLADALYLSGQPALALKLYESLYAETKDPELADQISKVTAGAETPAAAPGEPTDVPPPPKSPEGLLARAHELAAAKNYKDAAVIYREYLKVRPDDDEARSALAHVLALQGYLDEALALYQQIISRHPSDLPSLLAVAKILVWQKKAGAARAHYEQILQLDPGNLEAKRGMGDILYWSGEIKQSLRYYDEIFAVTQDPEVGQRIREIRDERLSSPRAPIGLVLPEISLPFRDYAKAGAGYYAYTNGIAPEKTGLFIDAAKSIGKYTLAGKLELINRFGLEDLPITTQLFGPLWEKAWGHATIAFAASPTFVPNVDVEGEVFQGLGPLHEALTQLEASFGWRHLFFMYESPLFIKGKRVAAQEADVLTPSLTAYLPHKLWLTEKVYYVLKTGAITLSSRLTWRPTDRLEFFASAGFGTSGERIIAIQDIVRADTKSFQAGIIFPITDDFSGEMTGLYEDRGFLYIRQGGAFNLIWNF